jgi:hypothetical protein
MATKLSSVITIEIAFLAANKTARQMRSKTKATLAVLFNFEGAVLYKQAPQG